RRDAEGLRRRVEVVGEEPLLVPVRLSAGQVLVKEIADRRGDRVLARTAEPQAVEVVGPGMTPDRVEPGLLEALPHPLKHELGKRLRAGVRLHVARTLAVLSTI